MHDIGKESNRQHVMCFQLASALKEFDFLQEEERPVPAPRTIISQPASLQPSPLIEFPADDDEVLFLFLCYLSGSFCILLLDVL